MDTLFHGFVPRLMASMCPVISMYSAVIRRFRPALAVVLFLLAVFITYGGEVFRWLGVF